METFRRTNRGAIVRVSVMLMLIATIVRVQIAAQALKPVGALSGNAENGKRIFTKYGCYECHGLQGQGSPVSGPRIGPDPVPFELFARYIREPTGDMPPYTAKVVSDKELADIYAFLKSLPHPPAPRPPHSELRRRRTGDCVLRDVNSLALVQNIGHLTTSNQNK